LPTHRTAHVEPTGDHDYQEQKRKQTNPLSNDVKEKRNRDYRAAVDD
jgi:hypothetical protein